VRLRISRCVASRHGASPSRRRSRRSSGPRAAGRCQYAGCNASLIGDEISGATNASKGYIGHIVADSADGPRGHHVLSAKLAHDPDNLTLVCDAHHRLFDRELVAEHPVEVLREMKRRHEARMRIVTAIDEDRGSQVIR